MVGYWKNEEATKKLLGTSRCPGGGFNIDNDGFLLVLGRDKSLLIGGDGEKYSPEGIE